MTSSAFLLNDLLFFMFCDKDLCVLGVSEQKSTFIRPTLVLGAPILLELSFFFVSGERVLLKSWDICCAIPPPYCFSHSICISFYTSIYYTRWYYTYFESTCCSLLTCDFARSLLLNIHVSFEIFLSSTFEGCTDVLLRRPKARP